MTSRTAVLDALLAVMARGGVSAVSVRSVAAEAGVSPATVQYWFRTKSDLLTAALEHVNDRMEQRLSEVGLSGEPRRVLLDLLLAWFPLDEQRRADASAWLAFSAAAATDPRLRTLVIDNDTATLQLLGDWLDAHRNELALRIPPEAAASMLLASVDGFTVRALSHDDPSKALADLESFLELFTEGAP
ncbi:TetR/AcrR family transcriptional regulator [Luteococcus sp. OSA5]|uniref:TetR/AcrR family transcriptional regulator n=1 Tax=Luteococcus sp. OSA5 TaxID=3401630 RepID=UPI003B4324E8